MPLLSICIPTYNRSRLLAELLDSIIAQRLEDEIEVVVSDDASPDDTVAVAKSYESQIKNFKFITQSTNLGMGHNFLASIAAAAGEYIWLMGDDDRLETGGVQHVIDAVRRMPDAVGFSVGVIDFDSSMSRPTGLRRMPPPGILHGADAVFSQMAEVLSFMSALVVKRTLWNAQVNDPRVQSVKHLYVHVMMLGCVIGFDGKWGVVHETCVHFRSGNDQLKDNFGWLQRIKIDVLGHDEIADALFKHTPRIHAAMRHRILNSHVLSHVVNAKSMPCKMSDITSAIYFLTTKYYRFSSLWTKTLPILILPSSVVKLVRRVYRRFSPSSGLARVRQVTVADS